MPSWRAQQAIDRKLMSRPLPRASRTKRLSARLLAIVGDIFVEDGARGGHRERVAAADLADKTLVSSEVALIGLIIVHLISPTDAHAASSL
jgi:hypothetical protein